MYNLKKAILPEVQECEGNGKCVKIGKISRPDIRLEYNGEGDIFESGIKRLEKAFSGVAFDLNSKGNYLISFSINRGDSRFTDKCGHESYVIDINDKKAEIVGFDEAGAFYGAVSFAQLIHTEKEDVLIPECRILDYPKFAVRGNDIECRYGTDFLTLEDLKSAVDYFADQKFNTLELNVYGCWVRQYDGVFAEYMLVPFKKYPDLKTPRSIKYYNAMEERWEIKEDVLPTMYEEDYLSELIGYAKKKNITVVLQFSSLGHNTLIPRLYPETSTKDADGTPNGAAFCTRNEKTKEIIFDIFDEIIEKYLKPHGITSFGIGVDEVFGVRGIDENDLDKIASGECKCEKCRDTDQTELIIDYIVMLFKFLKEKGMKTVYLCYDEFCLSHKIMNEKMLEKFKEAGVDDVVCFDWWDYRGRDKVFESIGEEDKDHLFRNIAKPMAGYYNWCGYYDSTENIIAVTDWAIKRNHEGIFAYTTLDYGYDYLYGLLAECAWNPGAVKEEEPVARYAKRVFPKQSEKAADILKKAYKYWQSSSEVSSKAMNLQYYGSSYHLIGVEYPQDYPANKFKLIEEKKDEFLPYLENCIRDMSEVYNWFNDNTTSWQGDVMKHNALNYVVVCDYFYTLYTAAQKYNAGGEIDEFVSEANRLIEQIDKLIKLTQQVRIKGNQYTICRNLSIKRQALCDLLDYIDRETAKDVRPEINIFEFKKYLSDFSWYLR